MKKLAVVVGLGFLAAGCATTRAQAPATRPPLEVPPAPPRVIEPVPPQPSPHPEPVGDLPPVTTAAPKPKPQSRETPPRETQKPEPKPPETPAPETAVTTQPPPTAPVVPPLRTARVGDGAQAERQIRDILARANGLLARVNYQRLSAELQKAYNQAKQFIEGSETALKAANYEFAQELAEKAETLAKQLHG